MGGAGLPPSGTCRGRQLVGVGRHLLETWGRLPAGSELGRESLPQSAEVQPRLRWACHGAGCGGVPCRYPGVTESSVSCRTDFGLRGEPHLWPPCAAGLLPAWPIVSAGARGRGGSVRTLPSTLPRPHPRPRRRGCEQPRHRMFARSNRLVGQIIRTSDFGARDTFPTTDHFWPRIILVPYTSLSCALGIAPGSFPQDL